MDLSALAFEQSVRALDAALPRAVGEPEIEAIARRALAERTGPEAVIACHGARYRVRFSRYVEPSTQGDFVAISSVTLH